MRVGVRVRYDGGFAQVVEEIGELERAGLQLVSVAEAYGFDAVSQLGYLAAVTDRLELTSGILPVYSRTPTLTAMTAAGLDHVSGGRFTLGIGASGPQVVEGFHGVRYDAPLARQLGPALTSDEAPELDQDPSTVALVERYRELRGRAV